MRIKKPVAGFSLIEVVVVMGIVSLAVSLFVPLILKTRDQIRRSQCADNLRRLGMGWVEHENALGFYPSSGWGWRWTGDPDRGFGRRQPGGWAYSVARFTEYSDVVSQGAGAASDGLKGAGMLAANTTPLPIFYCPSRREVRTYLVTRNTSFAFNLPECAVNQCSVVRADYRANSGNISAGGTGGPIGDRSTFEIPSQVVEDANGVTTDLSEVRASQVLDGLSKTMCIGEKYLNVDHYFNGQNSADDNGAFSGMDRDNNGYTASASRSLTPRIDSSFMPRRDRRGLNLNWTFGSAHKGGLNIVNCDTSARFVNYKIDYMVFSRLGGRRDGPAELGRLN